MTNKTFSEQICEICRVVTTSCKYAKYGYEGEEEIWYLCKKNNKECWTYPHKDLTGCKDFELGNVDFENNNNNFVKLLEVLYKEIGLYDLFFITDNNRGQLKSDILKTIVELLSNKLGYKIPLITKIKKIIRETDWEI